MWIWLGLAGCMTGDRCDAGTYVSACVTPTRLRTCASVTNWLAYTTEGRVRERDCAPGRICDHDTNGRDVTCLEPLPHLCPDGGRDRVCFENDAYVCDPGAKLGVRRDDTCPDDHVCQTVFPELPACLSPWDPRLDGDPAREAWRGPARDEASARMDARRAGPSGQGG